MNGRLCVSLGFLGLLALLALFAPLLGLRNPNAIPDTLILESLAPMATAQRIELADGSLLYGERFEPQPKSGAFRFRNGIRERISAEELKGGSLDQALGKERFWLGTDELGRDLLSRMVYGARVSLLVGLVAAGMALAVGAGIGMVAGFAGGWVDGLLMRFTDLVLAIPRMFLALLLIALYGASTWTTVIVLGGTTWMAAARLVRAEILSARDRDFVLAAQSSGTPFWRLGWRHLLPSTLAPLVVESTLRVGDTILLESTLSYLGLGVQPPQPSWGSLISDGKDQLLDAWWISTLPGLAVVATVVALYMVGESVGARRGGYNRAR